MNYDLIYSGLLQGLILAIVSLGIMVAFRFLNFQDLTAEGAYPLGGAVAASLLIAGNSQVLAIFAGIIAGGLLTLCTAQVSLRLKINSLLAGIIISTMAYSVSLRLMGKPNIALFEVVNFKFGVLTLAIIICGFYTLFFLFLHTDFGLRLRAMGNNPIYAKNNGISIKKYTSLGLCIAGGLYGLAGSLVVQVQQFMDLGIGVGIVIHGLAGIMLGEAIIGNHTLARQILAPILGAIIFQQIQGLVLLLGLAPQDLKFFTGLVVLLVLTIKRGESNAL